MGDSAIETSILEASARVEVDTRKEIPWILHFGNRLNPVNQHGIAPGVRSDLAGIECSAMSMSQLGDTLDIHCGGRDLVFPHHENEIAQSEGATGCAFVDWMHNGFINIDEQKMSKSRETCSIFVMSPPDTNRLFCGSFSSARRITEIDNFSDAMLDEAAAKVAYFYETLRKWTTLLPMMTAAPLTSYLGKPLSTD